MNNRILKSLKTLSLMTIGRIFVVLANDTFVSFEYLLSFRFVKTPYKFRMGVEVCLNVTI